MRSVPSLGYNRSMPRDRTALVVGLGGIGAPAAAVLARSNLGRLVLVDPDVVEVSNLHRQVLYREADVGRPKAEVAAERLRALAPAARIEGRRLRVEVSNAREALAGADVVVDGTDTFESKFLLDDACAALGLPLVHAAATGWAGRVIVWLPNGPRLRSIFEGPPPACEAPPCLEAGVVGPVVAAVGARAGEAAVEVLEGRAAAGSAWAFDARTGRARSYHLGRRAA